MEYSELCDLYVNLEKNSKRLVKLFYLSNFLTKLSDEDVDDVFLLLDGKIFLDFEDSKIGVSDSIVIKAIKLSTGADQKEIEALWKKKGDLGLVVEHFIKNKKQVTLFKQKISVSKVVYNLKKLSSLEGQGTVNQKVQLISELLTSAEPVEGKFIVRTILETLRIGISSGSIRDAIIWSVFKNIPGVCFSCEKCGMINPVMNNEKNSLVCLNCNFIDDRKVKDREDYNILVQKINDAYNICGDFSLIYRTLKNEGLAGIENIKPSLNHPMKLMLYQKVKNVKEAFEKVGSPAAIEYKYDGFRIQIHKSKKDVKIFTRRLDDVTNQFPDIIDLVKKYVNAENVILDGEVVGYDTLSKEYLPFQKISQRIRRKYDVSDYTQKIGVELTLFDILYYGKSYLNIPFLDRRKKLESIVDVHDKKIILSKILITDDVILAEKFYAEALSEGKEGVMFKNLKAIYQPGSRVGFGVKLKPIMDPLDLVIVGAEWGEGKRANMLTSFIVACKSGENYLEIGKVGTGFKEIDSEISFKNLTDLLVPLIYKDGKENDKIVRVKPSVVLEIAFEEIQKSKNYNSGYALRFPRVLRLRNEKPVDEISTLETVEKYYFEQIN